MATPPPPDGTLRARLTAGGVILRQLPGTLRLVWEADRRGAIVTVALTAALALLPAAVAWIGKLIVDGVVQASRSGDPAERARVLWLVGAEAGLIAVQMAGSRLLSLQRDLLRGSVARFVPLFAWVGIDMVLWGFMSRYLNSVATPGYNFVPALLGAVLLWDFFTRVMQGVTTAFFEDVWSRNFLNMFATPLSIAEYLGGLMLSSIATSAIGLLFMLVVAGTVFGLSFFVYGLLLLPFLLLLFLFGIAMGVLGSSIVLRLGPAAEWFVWPIPALVSPFAGVFYPLSTLPGWMQAIAHLLPPSYVFESMRRILAGGTVPISALAWSGALAALDILLACWVFTRVYRRAVRTGLIARYSAETVS
jgi:ABC-2 type transport system permease protein